MTEPLFPRVGLKQVLSEKERTEQLQMNSKYARNLIDEKTYRDWLKEFIEKNYSIEDRNYSAEEFEDVWWHYHFTFCKEHYADHLNNCHRGITRFFRLLIDDSLKSDDHNFIQNKINEGTKKYKLLMQERIKERVEEVLKKNLDTSS